MARGKRSYKKTAESTSSGKENDIPGSSHSPQTKRVKLEEDCQVPRTPLGMRDENVPGKETQESSKPQIPDFFPKVFKQPSPKRQADGGEPSKDFGNGMSQRREHVNKDLQKEGESSCSGISCQEEQIRRQIEIICQRMSECHITEKLQEISKSVCNIIVLQGKEEVVSQGTGFVLFDNLIMTNAHLFENYVQDKNLLENVEVRILFNQRIPQPNDKYLYFAAEKQFVAINNRPDYAVLELNPEGRAVNHEVGAENLKIPAGILKEIGPPPENGVIFVMGHPKGGEKKRKSIRITESEKRRQAVEDNINKYKDLLLTFLSICEVVMNQGIEDIYIGGKKARDIVTYCSSMREGSSGSPVFDIQGQVFGMHTGGYGWGFPKTEDSAIEFAYILSIIIKDFAYNLKKSVNDQLMKRLESVASQNLYLKQILEHEPVNKTA